MLTAIASTLTHTPSTSASTSPAPSLQRFTPTPSHLAMCQTPEPGRASPESTRTSSTSDSDSDSLGMRRLSIRTSLLKPTPRRAPPPTPLRPTRHRRTQSHSDSYGYMLSVPPSKDMPPSARRHSASPPPSPSMQSQTQSQSSLQRLMLVNPAIAAHLRRGGMVHIRSVDGTKGWKIRMPEYLLEKAIKIKTEQE